MYVDFYCGKIDVRVWGGGSGVGIFVLYGSILCCVCACVYKVCVCVGGMNRKRNTI